MPAVSNLAFFDNLLIKSKYNNNAHLICQKQGVLGFWGDLDPHIVAGRLAMHLDSDA